MANATKEQMKEEAITRMELLHIHPNAIQDFNDKGIVNCSQFGALFWLTEEQQKRVEEFEKESGNLVYHVIENHYVELGRMLTFLYVSPDMDEWEQDREELAAGEPLTYVANLSDEVCSEYGHVGIELRYGGLMRVW